jgi:hypothetical protein
MCCSYSTSNERSRTCSGWSHSRSSAARRGAHCIRFSFTAAWSSWSAASTGHVWSTTHDGTTANQRSSSCPSRICFRTGTGGSAQDGHAWCTSFQARPTDGSISPRPTYTSRHCTQTNPIRAAASSAAAKDATSAGTATDTTRPTQSRSYAFCAPSASPETDVYCAVATSIYCTGVGSSESDLDSCRSKTRCSCPEPFDTTISGTGPKSNDPTSTSACSTNPYAGSSGSHYVYPSTPTCGPDSPDRYTVTATDARSSGAAANARNYTFSHYTSSSGSSGTECTRTAFVDRSSCYTDASTSGTDAPSRSERAWWSEATYRDR